MSSIVNRFVRTKRNAVFSSWLVASVFAHALLIPVLLLMNSGTPYGTRVFGSGGGDTLSLTWIPGSSSGPKGTTDTVIPGEDDQGVVETSAVSPERTVEPANRFVVESDPQTVFNDSDATAVPLLTDDVHATRTHREPAESSDVKTSAQKSSTNNDEDALAGSSSTGRQGTPGGDGAEGRGTGSGDDPSSGTGNRVEFFGIQSRGKRVVYLIDASESMRQHRAIDLAREELWRSLSALKVTSQFQIVFFDLKCHTFPVAGNSTRMVAATSQHLRLAKQFMAGIRPDSGTDRLLAITHALSFDPEVLFLLTDVDAPELNAQDLAAIRRSNKRQAAIHSVEFGIGPDLTRDSFLKKLARQNRGTHRYVDLKNPQP